MSDESTEKSEFELAFEKEAEKRDIPDSQEVDELEDLPEDPEPVEAPGPADTPEEAANLEEKPEIEGEPAEEPDPYEGMTDEVKARFVTLEEEKGKLEHRIKSDDGRVNAYQRQVTELSQQIEQIQKSSAKAQPTNEEIKDAMEGDDADWDSFKEDYPEVANAIDGRFSRFESKQAERIDTVLTPVIEDQAEKQMEKAYEDVADEFPTWQDAVKEQNFNDWLVKQPAAVRDLSFSDDVNDASSLIGLYDDHRIANNMPSLRKADDPGNGDPVDDSADDLGAKRKRQLEAGSVVPSKPARINTEAEEGEDEFERSFNAYAARKEAANRT